MHPRIRTHLVHAIRQALTQAHAPIDAVRAISLNLSGDPAAFTEANARQWLKPLGLSAEVPVVVDDDGLSAWAAGGRPDPAIWVLLGTNWGSGAMVRGQRVAHPLDRLDLDASFGEVAGGATVGSNALSAAIHSQLGGPATALFDAYRTSLEAHTVDELVEWARAHITREERATLFKPAAEVAQHGDLVAIKLFKRSGTLIGAGTGSFGRYLPPEAGTPTILLTGKAWQMGDLLLAPFREALHARLPHAEVRLNTIPQSVGSALLAMSAAGVPLTEEILARASH
jgi:N-acetylglucosamine kinase-like BadF-type ATPase